MIRYGAPGRDDDDRRGFPDVMGAGTDLELVRLMRGVIPDGTVQLTPELLERLNRDLEPGKDKLWTEEDAFQFVVELVALVDEYSTEKKETEVFWLKFKGTVQLWAYVYHTGSGQSFDLDLDFA